jgi:hypothetical protein
MDGKQSHFDTILTLFSLVIAGAVIATLFVGP